MDNVRTKKRQWRPRRPDDQQPQGRKQIRLTRMDDTLKVVLKNDSCQRQVIHNHCRWSEPKPVTTSVQDRFHWSKPKCQEATTNKQSSKVQQYSDKSQTKADMSQLAGFVKKRSSSDSTTTRTTVHTSDVIKSTSHTCDDKPVYNESRNSFCSPLKEISSVPDSVPCGIKHRTILGPATKPPCLKADKRSVVVVEPDHDFDYSLDLMGDYTLKVSDHYKEPTPFWFEAGQTTCRTCVQVKPANLDTVCTTDQRPSLNKSLDTTCWHPQQFTPETDIGIVLDTTQDDEELDSIMNSKRGYTYINNSRHRGLKRRIAYDDEEEVPIPCKRPRSC